MTAIIYILAAISIFLLGAVCGAAWLASLATRVNQIENTKLEESERD